MTTVPTSHPPTTVTFTSNDGARIREFGEDIRAHGGLKRVDDQPSKTLLPPPTSLDFIRGDFLPSPPMADLAETLIARYEYLRSDTKDLTIKYLWKAKGGAKGGKAVMGKCVKPSGLAGYYAGADFVIWLAADHAWAYELKDEQIEALLFHELLHIGKEATDNGPVYYVRPHDFEGFKAEIHEYGFWLPEIKEIANVFQLRLEDAIAAEAVNS